MTVGQEWLAALDYNLPRQGFLISPEVEADAVSKEPGDLGRVLTVMNHPAVAGLLAYCLTAAGFKVRTCKTFADGLVEMSRFAPDVIVVDSAPVDSPDTESWRRMRAEKHSNVEPAVVVLTGNAGVLETEPALELPSADRVPYPFSVRDLVLRLDDIVRGRRGVSASAADLSRRRRYFVGPLELDVEGHYALVNGVEIQVSPLEMRLLSDLIQHRGRVRTRRDLLVEVWGYSEGVSTRTIDTHVNRLRMKLGPAGALVETVRGAGYRLSGDFQVVVKE